MSTDDDDMAELVAVVNAFAAAMLRATTVSDPLAAQLKATAKPRPAKERKAVIAPTAKSVVATQAAVTARDAAGIALSCFAVDWGIDRVRAAQGRPSGNAKAHAARFRISETVLKKYYRYFARDFEGRVVAERAIRLLRDKMTKGVPHPGTPEQISS